MNYIKDFNWPNTHLVISDYPEKTSRGEKNYGIAWYTKETLVPIAEKYNQKFIVLAEKGIDNKPTIYADGKILVLRVFDPQHHTLFPIILKWLFIFSDVKNVYVHSEFCTNGGVRNFILLIPFLTFIKLFGKKISYFAHNVVTDASSIAPHLGLRKKSFFLNIFNISLKLYYRFLGLIVDKIIVMDSILKKRLEKFVDEKKVVFIPIWTLSHVQKKASVNLRKKLRIKKDAFILLYFGFITWYKGADWLIDQVKKISASHKGKKLHLVLAGGMAYSLKHKAYYKKFYARLIQAVNGVKNITITGFVPEGHIGNYFSVADVVVFPYRGYIGSSGVLSCALSYKKPFILSEHMANLCQDQDFVGAMEKYDIRKTDIVFGYNTSSLEKLIARVQDSTVNDKMKQFSSELQKTRSKDMLLHRYYQSIYAIHDHYAYNTKIGFLSRMPPHELLTPTAK